MGDRIAVDHLGHLADQGDDALGHEVARRRLAADQYAAGSPVRVLAILQAGVEVDHMEDVEELALVFVDALHLDVEQGIRVEVDTAVLLHQGRQAHLVGPLHLVPALSEGRLAGMPGQAAQLVEMSHPGLADGLVDQLAQAWIGRGQPAPLGDAVGLVVELVGPELVELLEQALLEQVGVQFGNAVHREAADDGEIGHAHLGIRPFLDQGQPRQAAVVAWPAPGHLGQETGVDLVDDVHQPRQQLAEHAHRPLLQGLRQQGVVGVGHGAAGDGPGLIPAEAILVHEQAHQFRHGAAGMGVVKLEDVLGGELAEVATVPHHPAVEHILEAGRGEEVLLLEAQFLAVLAGIVGVEHHGDVLGDVLGRHGFGIGTGVELAQVELVRGRGFP